MDPRTAFVITTAFALLNGGILGLMHRGLSRDIRPSAADWRIGTLLAAGGVLLLAAQSPDSAWLLLPVGNTSIFLGFALYWRALRRFDHLPDTAWIYLPVLIGTCALTWFTVVTPLLWIRVCITTLVWDIMIGGASYSLLSRRQTRHEIGRICLAGILIVLICFMSFRGIYYSLYLRDAQTILSSEHWINALTPISAAILPVIGTTAFLMMCSERLRAELAARAIELDQKNADLKQAILAREDAERIARHDLKTPLASIAAAPALLRQSSDDREELLQMIEGAARRALNMVNLSLDLYHMEKGQYQLHATAVDMNSIVHTILDDLRVHASAKRLQLQFVASHPSIIASADAALCYSCLANLIKNAIEAASVQSTISIQLHQGDMVQLNIHNDTAVPQELRHCFFEKYATLGKDGGSGLGTYSSKLLATVQHGDLGMRSSDEEGTTLSLSLPLYHENTKVNADVSDSNTLRSPAITSTSVAETPMEPIPSTPSPLSPSQITQSFHILMADDDIYNSKVIRHQLLQFGVKIETALNGKFAWYACLKKRPDLILMDIEMPIMNGIDALHAIRNLQSIRRQTPSFIVAFSSNDEMESQRRFLSLGFDHCLSKPASSEALFQLISNLPLPSSNANQWDPVEIHPQLFFDIELYLKSRSSLLSDLEQAIDKADVEAVRKIAHKLSGSFALYGFNWAAQHCKLIETETQTLEYKAAQVKELALHLSEVPIAEAEADNTSPS